MKCGGQRRRKRANVPKFVTSNPVYEALHAAGVFAEDPNNVRRVIIDLQAGSAAKFYVECFLDSKFTEVIMDGSLKLVESDDE